MGRETFRNIAVGTPDGNDEYVDVLVAREYDSTSTYARGDYCVKAGQAYRCINAIDAPQVWTPANWTAVYFGDELARIAREGGGGGGGGNVYPYDSTPAALGTAAPGVSEDYARGDHVHPMPSAADIGALATAGGTMSGNIAMGSNKITGLADAQNSGDAVNKGQLDAAIQGIGTVFNIKGDVATVSDLPATGNNVGDVYYVASVSAGYIWIETTDHPTGYWEELGEPIDLSGYIEKPASASANQILYYNGSAWDAKTETPEVTISTAGAVTQAMDAGKIYHFTGAVTSLSLTLNAAASGQIAQYHFDFDSGSTPATVTLTGVTWPDGSFTPEANKHYEVDILNGYGVYLSW